MNQWNGGNGYPPGMGGFPQPQQQYAPPPSFGGGNRGGDPFAGLNEADPSGDRLPFFEPGLYTCTVDKIVLETSRKNQTHYKIACMIDESTNPARPAGTRAICFIDMDNTDMRGKNLKRFLAAVLGANPEQEIAPSPQYPQGWSPKGPVTPDGRPWNQVATESYSGTQPLRGRKVALEVVQTKTKNGNDFSLHLWHPFTGQAAAPAAAPVSMPAHPTQYGLQAPAAPQQQVMPPGFNPGATPPGFNPAMQPGFNPTMPHQGQAPQQQVLPPAPQQGFPPGFNPGAPPQGWNPQR